jgi:hypothetical protein
LAKLFLDIRLWRPALRLALPSKVPTVLEAMPETALALKPSVIILVAPRLYTV